VTKTKAIKSPHGGVVQRIPWHPTDDGQYPLGRHINHDPRSLDYLVKPRASLVATTPILWQHRIAVLDQGSLGSCTGNATVGVLGTDPFYDTLAKLIAGGLSLDEALAVAIYSDATKIDPYSGAYPPTDTGSDGLSVAKAAKARGLISGYLHCTSLDATRTALRNGPVLAGINWYQGFDNPDSSGNVAISGSVRGGHEPCIVGDDGQQWLRFLNSWGPGWGDHGYFNVTYSDFDRLLHEQGDATSLVPITQPPPPPPPTPGFPADAADRTFASTATATTKRSKPFKTWSGQKSGL
jgi:hypothetical protein